MNEGNSNLKQLGTLIKRARIAAGLSSGGAAEQLGRSATHYSRLESGLHRPSLPLLNRMGDLFRIAEEDRQLWMQLAGFATAAEKTSIEDSEGRPQPVAEEPAKINLNPETTPVLFSDSMFVTISDNGVVLDFAQKAGPTNEQQIVTRVGVSDRHAQKIYDLLGNQLKQLENIRQEGENREGSAN